MTTVRELETKVNLELAKIAIKTGNLEEAQKYLDDARAVLKRAEDMGKGNHGESRAKIAQLEKELAKIRVCLEEEAKK